MLDFVTQPIQELLICRKFPNLLDLLLGDDNRIEVLLWNGLVTTDYCRCSFFTLLNFFLYIVIWNISEQKKKNPSKLKTILVVYTLVIYRTKATSQ